MVIKEDGVLFKKKNKGRWSHKVVDEAFSTERDIRLTKVRVVGSDRKKVISREFSSSVVNCPALI